MELPENWSKDCVVSIVTTPLVVHRPSETEENNVRSTSVRTVGLPVVFEARTFGLQIRDAVTQPRLSRLGWDCRTVGVISQDFVLPACRGGESHYSENGVARVNDDADFHVLLRRLACG